MLYRIAATFATSCGGEILGPEHNYPDTLWVTAASESEARATAVASWPLLATIGEIKEYPED